MLEGAIWLLRSSSRDAQRDMMAAACLQSVQREVRSACLCVLYSEFIAAIKDLAHNKKINYEKIELSFVCVCVCVCVYKNSIFLPAGINPIVQHQRL